MVGAAAVDTLDLCNTLLHDDRCTQKIIGDEEKNVDE